MSAAEIKKISQNLIKFIDPKAKVEVTENDGYKVKIESEDSGLLIGKFGESLECLQYILRMMVAKKMGEFVPLTVDAGEYKEKKENELKELVVMMATNVKQSGYAQELKPMSAYERRIVHVALKDIEGIKAESIGEGDLRRIKIEKI